jgi:hexosaminidase
MKLILSSLFIVMLFSFSSAQSNEINIVPKPRTVNYGTGKFTLRKDTKIVTLDDNAGIASAKVLNEYLQKNYGFELKVITKLQKSNAITFLPVATDQFGGDPNEIKSEKYSLNIQSDKITIGGTFTGQFYAIQSLLQLLPTEFGKEASLPVAKIVDSPRFPYRGMHLDVSRHFFPVEFVKKYIDLMAQYKFNYFHWHLTDDQGWRIEIKKYPRLTEIGSKRPESALEHNLQPYVGDKTPVEGFYTQDQIRDVVAYAKARYITVIPEIEIPGHSSAALAAYPELSCKADNQYKVQTTWGIFKEVYCPTEKTFQFLQDVMDEVISLFPDSPYIHIGGDEVLKDMWKDSPEVQELMKRENLKDLNEVQSYIVQRMEKYINSKGKKIIGWDEILDGGLAPNATVMSWRGIKGGITAAKAHHDVIMTPTDFAYLDYGQGDPAYEPINIGNYLTLEKTYSFDPVPKELTPDEAKFIIGGQGNVWTEYMADPQKVEYMVFPRMLALAEDVWTAPENKNYADFTRRLGAQFARLDKENVNYRIPEPVGLKNQVLGQTDTAYLDVKSLVPGAAIYFTYDGKTPTTSSSRYEGATSLFREPAQVRDDLKLIEVLPNGRSSAIYSAIYLHRPWVEAVDEPKDKRPGGTYAFLIPGADTNAEPTLLSGETKTTGFQQFARVADLKQPFTVSFDGYINFQTDAIYEFQTDSTWDAEVTVDSEKLIDTTGTKERVTTSAVIPLKAGYHKISLRYNHRGGNAIFRVRYGIKGQGLRPMGGGELFH